MYSIMLLCGFCHNR